MGFTTLFLIAVTSSNLVHGFPNTTPSDPVTSETATPAPSESTPLSPNQLAFDKCDFVADCNHMHGKIPIPCANDYCDRFLLCIDNRPVMQQCDPVKHWLFWSKNTNFNPLSLQCEEDFKTCDWYLTVRLSSSDDDEDKPATSSNDTVGYDTTALKAAADLARDSLLNDLKKRASDVIQQVTNSTADMIEELKQKTEEISKTVKSDTLAVLQDLQDENAHNSTHVAQVVMRAIIDQIHVSAGQVKDGISSVVTTMKEQISGVLSSFQENAAKEIETARESLHKVLPKPIEDMAAPAELPVANIATKEEEKKVVDKPVEPVQEKTVDKRDLNDQKVNVTSTPAQELMQGDDPQPKEEKPTEKTAEKPAEKSAEKSAEKPVEKPAENPVENPAEKPTEKPTEKTKEEEEKVEKEDKKDDAAGSASVSSVSYYVAVSTGCVVIAQFL